MAAMAPWPSDLIVAAGFFVAPRLTSWVRSSGASALAPAVRTRCQTPPTFTAPASAGTIDRFIRRLALGAHAQRRLAEVLQQ